MSAWSARRIAGAGAIAFVALAVVAFLLAGESPAFDDDAQTMVDYFQDKHDRVLVSTILIGAALFVFIWVIGELCRMLGDAGYRELAWVSALGGAVTTTILAVCLALFGASAQIAVTGGDPETIRSLFQVTSILQAFLGWSMLAIVIAIAVAALRGVFERWWAWVNAVIAVLLVLQGVSVQADGVFGAGSGLFSIAGFVAFLVFMLLAGYMLWRSAEPGDIGSRETYS
jgi:hypothetical protein